MGKQKRVGKIVWQVGLALLLIWTGMPFWGGEMAQASISGQPAIQSTSTLFAGGDGSAENPYQIATAEQLNAIRNVNTFDVHFKLINNIDLSGFGSGEGWVPIVGKENMFGGTFDGQGYVINGLTINRNMVNQGLFADNYGVVKNVKLEEVAIGLNRSDLSYRQIGGIAGLNNGLIVDSHVKGKVKGYGVTGGVAGFNRGVIRRSSFNGEINASFTGGGIAGQSLGEITESYAKGKVTVLSNDGGGLIGDSSGKVSYSYADVIVKGEEYVGGLTGSQYLGEIKDSYAVGTASGKRYVGGLIGYTWNEEVTVGSYWNKSKYTASPPNNGIGIAATDGEMKQRITYSDWDFANVWYQYDGYDPFLRWQDPYKKTTIRMDSNELVVGDGITPVHVIAEHQHQEYDVTRDAEFVVIEGEQIIDVSEAGEVTPKAAGEAVISVKIYDETFDVEIEVLPHYTISGVADPASYPVDNRASEDEIGLPVTVRASLQPRDMTVDIPVEWIDADENNPFQAGVPGTYRFNGSLVNLPENMKNTNDITTTVDVTVGNPYFIVTYESNGGSDVALGKVEHGASATSPVPPAKKGYTFEGWYADKVLTESYDFSSVVTEEVTLYAKWKANKYEITFVNTGGGASPISQTKQYGSLYGKGADGDTDEPLPVLTNPPGRTFKWWFVSGSLETVITDETTVSIDQNHMLLPYFDYNEYVVSFDALGGTVNPAAQTKRYRSTYGRAANGYSEELMPTPTKPGHTFNGWYANADATGSVIYNNTYVDETRDHTLYAKWTINSYTISYDSDGGSMVASESVEYGGLAAMPAVPIKEGYTFAGWHTDKELTESYSFNTPVIGNMTLYAKWTIKSYPVSFDSTGGSVMEGEYAEHGKMVAVPAPPTKTGFTFSGWYTDIALTDEYHFSLPVTGDLTLYAKWTMISYTVVYDSTGGSAIASETVKYGDSIAIPDQPTKKGYTFEGWYTDKELTESYDFNLPVTGDLSLFASWSINLYTITFDAGTVELATQIKRYGSEYGKGADGSMEERLPIPSKLGYSFGGWYADAGATGPVITDLTIVTEARDHTLHAKWTINSLTVSYDSNGGSTVVSESVKYGDVAAVPDQPTKAGYTFAGWFTDKELTEGYDFSLPVTGDITLYAAWLVNSYTVAYESNGGSAVASERVDDGKSAAEPASPTKAGYTFAGWFTDKELTESYDFSLPVTGDITLYAAWLINNYTVAYQSNGGSTVVSESLKYGDAAAVPDEPTKAGYTFAGWFTDKELTESYDFSLPVTDDLTLHAKWTEPTPSTPISYTITYESNGGSAVASERVEDGKMAAEPAPPTKAGYTFAGWFTDKELTESYNSSLPVTGDITLYAKWAEPTPSTPDSYTVTYESNGGSAVASERVEDGKMAAEPASPTKAGYTFDGWFTDKELTVGYDFSLLVTGDITLYAKWTETTPSIPNSYTITYESNGGSAVASERVEDGKMAAEPALPTKAGYTFAGWFTDKELTESYNFSLPVTGDITLYAKWTEPTPSTPNSFTITYQSNDGSAVASERVDDGKMAAEPASPTKAGYTFAGWYTDKELTEFYDFSLPVTFDITLYAKWTETTPSIPNSYTITFESNGGSAVASERVEDGKMAAEPAPPTKAGYTFAGWYTDKELTKNYDFSLPVTVDITLYAKWIPKQTGGNSGGIGTPAAPDLELEDLKIELLVNGLAESIGIATATTINNQTKMLITIDREQLEAVLAAKDIGATITIPMMMPSDIAAVEFNGEMVSYMDQLGTVIVIQTEKATYTLPVQQMNSNVITQYFGENVEIKDMKIHIELSSPEDDIVQIVSTAAELEQFSLVVKPLEFKVTVTYQDKSVEVSKFNAYVERTIVLPDDIDPNQIITGVVIEPDGTVRHVPTKVVFQNGSYYAVINSMTNSTYAVVKKTVQFQDLSQHWAQQTVHDVGSRMIINGNGKGMFLPDQDITRAEFAAILMRGLGIRMESGMSRFTDVSENDWYNSAVQAAYNYGIIEGFADGTFRPTDKVTREQAVAMLARAMELTGLQQEMGTGDIENALHSFMDANLISDWAKSSFALTIDAGLISGKSDSLLDPQAYTTRAEAAVLIYKLLQKSDLI
ncbi:hypothetical protein D3P07_13065 [Paenibacillus sp. 1011MAR3C5]|uniref:InlB B-repeat-containing protein n=1 Tax=Paenibacillus sp. 1011MAR3C5 TaxID=1675787 RepID=UPI000E6D2DEB|nr:InlB B-repeat-containing protein [Paenibacillus sp. 1011MAR3C5]RJE88885.1 hypothetical protein D3P07_13065 [Paenibacillus sp. 1011MAR3C5]